MLVFDTIHRLRNHLAIHRLDCSSSVNPSVGFVPTMGALHQGHLALVEASKQKNGLTVASIFVNPTQFNNPGDLARYPRTLEEDLKQLENAGCNVVFTPSIEEIYPTPTILTLNFGELERVMEGAFRPGHFNGVGIVVSKLFHIVQPDRVYFGQKDLQQVAIVKRLIRDLSFPIELIRVPTLREIDGLAMSSRNRNLTLPERQQAPILYRALVMAQQLLQEGRSLDEVKQVVVVHFQALPDFQLEYFEIANADTLQPVNQVQAPGMTALCLAAYLGRVRLIDNVVF